MGTLISNGSSLYRYNSFLLRTPLTISLNPSDMLVNPFGKYSLFGSVWDIDGGVRKYYGNAQSQTDFDQVLIDTAEETVLQMLNPPWYVGWGRRAKDFGFVWYHGAYSPYSANDVTTSYGKSNYYSEYFIQFASYRFTIPSGLDALNVTGWDVSYDFSSMLGFGSAAQGYNRLSGVDYTGAYVFSVGSNGNLSPSQVYSLPAYVIPDCSPCSGSPYFEDYWGSSSTRDGCIPIVRPLNRRTVSMNNACVSILNENRSAYVFVCCPFGIVSGGPYPRNTTRGAHNWYCHLIRGLTSKITLE